MRLVAVFASVLLFFMASQGLATEPVASTSISTYLSGVGIRYYSVLQTRHEQTLAPLRARFQALQASPRLSATQKSSLQTLLDRANAARASFARLPTPTEFCATPGADVSRKLQEGIADLNQKNAAFDTATAALRDGIHNAMSAEIDSQLDAASARLLDNGRELFQRGFAFCGGAAAGGSNGEVSSHLINADLNSDDGR